MRPREHPEKRYGSGSSLERVQLKRVSSLGLMECLRAALEMSRELPCPDADTSAQQN